MLDCSSAVTPGTVEKEEDDVKDPLRDDIDKDTLSNTEKTKMRKIIALANYLSQDRPSLGFAVKEMARTMSSPSEATSRQVKRLGRFLQGQPREMHLMCWQAVPKKI